MFFTDSYSVVSRSSRAKQYKILVERPSTLKNHCELKSGLTDKPDTVLESSDDSEQNQWGWFFDFFEKIFCTGPLHFNIQIFENKGNWRLKETPTFLKEKNFDFSQHL